MNIYLIRHGRQESSDCNVNVALSEAGRQQAALLGKRMQYYAIDAVYCSQLIRAVETAEIAFSSQKALWQEHQVREGLAEFDFGVLTGKPDSEVKQFYQDYYEKQMTSFAEEQKRHDLEKKTVQENLVGNFFIPYHEIQYPEGENGEEVLTRVMEVLREWIHSGKQNIAAVTHGGVIRILMAALFGGDYEKRLQFGGSLENCSITQILYDEKKNAFYLERFNDYAHLEKKPELLRSHFVARN